MINLGGEFVGWKSILYVGVYIGYALVRAILLAFWCISVLA